MVESIFNRMGHANSFPPTRVPSNRDGVADAIIKDINRNLGLNIPLRESGMKIPKDRSVEELCHQKLVQLRWKENQTALDKCIKDVYQYAEWNPTLPASKVASFLHDCLKKAVVAPPRRLALDDRAVQSFDPAILQRGPDNEIVATSSFSESESDVATEVAESDVEDADPPLFSHSIRPPGRMEHHHSHRLPTQRFFSKMQFSQSGDSLLTAGCKAPFMDCCPTLLTAPYPVRYECMRYVTACKVPLPDIEQSHAQAISRNQLPGPQRQKSPWIDQDAMRMDIERLTRVPLPSPVSSDVWTAALSESPNVSTSARLRFDKASSESIFSMEPLPFKLEPTTRRFFRKFGSTRFLVVKLPDINNPPSHLKPTKDNPLGVRLCEWLENLSTAKSFAGNIWECFFLRAVKDRSHKSADINNDAFEAFFFATQGPGLKSVSLEQLIEWHLPTERNRHRPMAKSFSRIELGLSNTHPTIQFTPSQIHYVDDKLANGDPEDTKFNDPALQFPAKDMDQIRETVMNDGCSRISHAAAVKAWELVEGKNECSLPSAFQARIGPAKGVWIVEDPNHAEERSWGNFWIEISASQKKFEPHSQDTDPNATSSELCRCTFEILSWSDRPSIGKLYKDFFPIIENRGVARSKIANMVKEEISQEVRMVESTLSNCHLLIQWLHKHTDNSVAKLSRSQPERLEDQLLRLLYAGFEPKKLKYAANLFLRMMCTHLLEVCVELKVDCACSTFVLGVQDPYGCLEPGQVHLIFSEEMPQPHGVKSSVMNNIDALVARHPALRPSDIQKISIVYEDRLKHLRNVAVFPTKGCTPLASKLQGGDYDGDRFWVCWDPRVVQDFRNAPAPITEPDPARLGVQKDRRTLGEVLDAGGVKRFISQGASLQLNESMLGWITNFRDQVCYMLSSIDAPPVHDFSDLHDVLVDSAKNGYSFGQAEWQKFRNDRLSSDERKATREPAWKTAKRTKKNLLDMVHGDKFQHKPEHIIDHVVFDVAAPNCYAFWQEFQQSVETKASDDDEHLSTFFKEFGPKDDTQSTLKEIKDNLELDIQDLLRREVRYPGNRSDPSFGGGSNNSGEWAETYKRVRVAFEKIQPRCRSSELAQILTMKLGTAPSYWDLLKGSALWCAPRRGGKTAQLCFRVCAKELCYLKAHKVGKGTVYECGTPEDPIYVTPEVLSGMKVRKSAAVVTELQVDADGDLEMATEDANGTNRNPVEHLSQIFSDNFSPFSQSF